MRNASIIQMASRDLLASPYARRKLQKWAKREKNKKTNSCNENGSHLEGVSSVSLPGFAASSYSTTRGQMIRFFFFLFEVAPVVGFGSNDELME